MRNKFFFIFAITCLFSNISAQEKYAETISLNWFESPYGLGIDQDKHIIVSTFDGASINAIEPRISKYLHHLPVSSNGTLKIEIIPLNTSPIKLDITDQIGSLTSKFQSEYTIDQENNNFQANLSILPIRKTSAGYEKLERFQLVITFSKETKPQSRGPEYAYESVLSTGTIYKIPIAQEGVYQITGKYLVDNLQIASGSISSTNLQVFSNIGGRLPKATDAERPDDLIEIPILVSDGGDGTLNDNDYFRFYAEGADRWKYNHNSNKYENEKNVYSLNNYIFVKIDGNNGKRIQTKNSELTPEHLSEEFDFLQIYEDDRTNLLGTFINTEGTGKDWYGDYFSVETSKSFENKFDISDLSNFGEGRIKMRLAARGENQTTVKLSLDGLVFEKNAGGTSLTDIEADYAVAVTMDEDINLTLNSTIGVEFVKSTSKDEAWLDYIQLEYRKKITNKYNQLRISDSRSLDYATAGFKVPSGNFSFWQITDLNEASIIQPNNGVIAYTVSVDQLSNFYMVKDNNYLVPAGGGVKVQNQNLHALERADLIIIHHSNFKDAANRLAEHRRNFSGLVVENVDVNNLYNEFSGGRLDPTAIRDFARMINSRDANFRYLLLIGDGSYDYRNLTPNLLDHNFIPAYETDESLDPINGFPSDDYYVLLSDGEGDDLKGAIDVAVGRLPVASAQSANDVIDKIINYDTNKNAFGNWRTKIAFVADDEDTNLHFNQADKLAERVELSDPIYNQSKIYFDSYVQQSTPGGDRYPDASEAINRAMQNGTLVMNYMGHGGPKGWSQERVLKISDIETWTNPDRLPVLITATCSFTGYDDPALVSAGEAAITKARGGVVALFTTVRAVYASENERLARAVFDIIFKKVDGEAQRFGDVIKDAKNKNADAANILNDRKFSLIGDPSQKIAIPKHNITTLSINGLDASIVDTLSALEKVTITGMITDEAGNLVSDFNGNIFPTIYDKESILETLKNDEKSKKAEFGVYRNILFKGSATVTNGEFSFTFVLPKDINYNFGKGRISYYAHNGGSIDAAGYFTNLIIGGSDPNGLVDDEGPELELFMNDENFVFGGTTNSNPTLLIKLKDDFGINVSGTSIGHDIVAVLDEDSKNSYILNDFYEANTDDYTSGFVRFPLKGLEPGKHSLTAKAWDVSNNSTEGRLEFTVINQDDQSLRRVYNYPNPFTTNTSFQFEHDLVGSDLEVYIDIYTVSGRLVKTIEQEVFASGYRIDNIPWDARDDYGSGLGKGLYLYKIKVLSRELNLSRESDFEKLIIL